MKTPLYIHYNAYDFQAPPGQADTWNNYRNPDSAKMFLACAHSWRVHGWEPQRLNSRNAPAHFRFTGALIPCAEIYPAELWDVWYCLQRLAPCWLCCTDVLNFGFFETFGDVAIREIQDGEALTTKINGDWSNSLCYVTPGFCETVIEEILAVDAGKLPLPLISVVSDESIIRDYRRPLIRKGRPTVYLAHIDPHWQDAELLHFPRSALQRSIDSFQQYP